VAKKVIFPMLKWLIQLEDKMLYARTPNIRATKYIAHTLTDLEREIDRDIIVVGDVGVSIPHPQ
jgi:hypothetical protein